MADATIDPAPAQGPLPHTQDGAVTMPPETGQAPVEPEPAPEPAALSPSEMEAELRRARADAAKYRNQRNEAQQKYDDAKKLFPNLDKMTPEQLIGTLEKEQNQRKQIERELRDMKLDSMLRSATQTAGVDHDLTVAVLRTEGKLKDVDIGDPGTGQVLSDMVTGLKETKPQLSVTPGASPVSGNGMTPGVSDGASPAAKAEAAYREGRFADYLRIRRESGNARRSNAAVTMPPT